MLSITTLAFFTFKGKLLRKQASTNMVFKQDEKLNLPGKDIISWYFEDPKVPDDKQIYIDAQDPKRYYTFAQARSTIRKLVAGFRKAGLQKGDTVCLHSFNDVGQLRPVNGVQCTANPY